MGAWLDGNGEAIYKTDRGKFAFGTLTGYTRRGNTLYVHVFYWPGETPAADWLSFFQPKSVVAIGGLKAKVQSARLLKTGASVKFEQDAISTRFTGLPTHAPDDPMTVIEVTCDSDPVISHDDIRAEWPRYAVGVSPKG